MIFEVVPGIGVKDQFILGTPIVSMINFLKSKRPHLPYQLQFSQDSPLESDICINIPLIGIKLTYDAISQRLKSLDIFDLERLQLQYQGNLFRCFVLTSSVNATPTFSSIYSLFGPIYPGSLDKNDYSLNYPGITFVFPIPESMLPLSPGELPFISADGISPILSRIYICSAVSPSHDPSDLYFEPITVLEDGIEFIFRQSVIKFNFKCQEILSCLGPPDDTMSKEYDKMGIHSPNLQRPNDDYFWNYFNLGIDFLLDGSKHTVKKIIIHTNFLGHYDVMKYCKCNFKFSDIF